MSCEYRCEGCGAYLDDDEVEDGAHDNGTLQMCGPCRPVRDTDSAQGGGREGMR